MFAVSVPKNSVEVIPRTMDIYIPPPDLAFRILGYESQCVLFSRTQVTPEVGQYSVKNPVHDNQWFTLLHGTGKHAGRYAIKARETHMVLFSRQQPEPRVGHTTGDGRYGDNWFTLEPGQGQYARYFRLVTPSENMAVSSSSFSRAREAPYLLHNGPAGEVRADQHYKFMWEEMAVERVEYELEKGEILSSTTLTLAVQTLTNKTDHEVQMTMSIVRDVANSCTFEYGAGFPPANGMVFSVGIPYIEDGKFKVESSPSHGWKWGETTPYTTKYTGNFFVRIPPHEVVSLIVTVNQGILTVPYTMYLSSKGSSSRIRVKTTGTWRGVSSWDLRDVTAVLEHPAAAEV